MPPRRCLLCGEQAQVCSRSRRHSFEDLTKRISKMLSAYLHH
ncbi:citrate lyase holo-[acyl-carrier protein] synthase [Mitsuokella multacida]|nr:citrate lyase holo-[acyl-carrier protein] synthase [Mitsuokella multacida]